MRNACLVILLCVSGAFAEAPTARHKVLFNRFRMPEIRIMISDCDGGNERALAPHSSAALSAEYSPSWSAGGQWIVCTEERACASDIYRIHPDGAGREQLTNDPAFDD